MQSLTLGKEPTQRKREGLGLSWGQGLLQCCHLLNLHIPEGTKTHSGAGQLALWRAFHCHCLWAGVASKQVPFGAGRAVFQGILPGVSEAGNQQQYLSTHPISPSSEGIQPKYFRQGGRSCKYLL